MIFTRYHRRRVWLGWVMWIPHAIAIAILLLSIVAVLFMEAR